MYIQPTDPRGREAFMIPDGYSGNAFRMSEDLTPLSKEEESLSPTLGGHEERAEIQENEHIPPNGTENQEEKRVESSPPSDGEAETISVMARKEEREKSPPTTGLLSRIPFLSSFLPPPRKGHGTAGRLPEWVIIAAVIFLLADDDGGDVLPFLLLLLLWD